MSKETTTKRTSGEPVEMSTTAPLPLLPNNDGPTQAKKRRVLSTPLQAMARIEAEMDKLEGRQKGVVYTWFQATYGPNVVAMAGQAEKVT